MISSLGRLATIDSRSLAAYRVGLGIVLCIDAIDRMRDLTAHYTEAGVLPLSTLHDWIGWRTYLSVFSWNGSDLWPALLLGLAATAGIAVAVGWHTRLALIVSWLLICSVHLRNPAIVGGSGNLLRVLTFWSLFLPLANRWSLDRKRCGGAARPRVTSLATFAILAQLTVMYWTTTALKLTDEWLSGSALEMALHLDYLATGLGRSLLAYPDLLRWGTYAALALEFLGPLLAWTLWWGGRVRFFAALTMILFHLVAIQSTLSVGLFTWVAAVAWLLFLPPWFWENTRWSDRSEPLVDGSAADGPAANGSDSSAPAVVTGILTAALLLTAWLNLQALGPVTGYVPAVPPAVDAIVEPISNFTGLTQRWRMFAPPASTDGWYVMPGRTLDGEIVDVWRRSELDWSKPDPVAPTYGGTKRWTKYLDNLQKEDYSGLRPHFLRYLCRRWQSENEPERWLEGVQLHFMEESFARAGERPVQRELQSLRCSIE